MYSSNIVYIYIYIYISSIVAGYALLGFYLAASLLPAADRSLRPPLITIVYNNDHDTILRYTLYVYTYIIHYIIYTILHYMHNSYC